MKKTILTITAAFALSGCAGLKSAGNLVVNSLTTPTTAVECLQRDVDKANLGTFHEVASAAFVPFVGAAAVATLPLAPIEIFFGQRAGAAAESVARVISEQKDLACKEIRESQ